MFIATIGEAGFIESNGASTMNLSNVSFSSSRGVSESNKLTETPRSVAMLVAGMSR